MLRRSSSTSLVRSMISFDGAQVRISASQKLILGLNGTYLPSSIEPMVGPSF